VRNMLVDIDEPISLSQPTEHLGFSGGLRNELICYVTCTYMDSLGTADWKCGAESEKTTNAADILTSLAIVQMWIGDSDDMQLTLFYKCRTACYAGLDSARP
jgi:hypothetical protein